jgi:serine/threonine protein kinase/tetratricopeptide (TPR) repeat protein
MIGRTIAHYRITARIGEGGMGVVYRARDERLERDVAFKVLSAGLLADESARRRFRKEALALSRLNHPNIQTVHDFDTQDDVDFLVTEYVDGVTLSDRVAAGALPEKDVLRLGAQLAEGLAAAHTQAIIHRDLKPGNLRVTPQGRLKILDFGLAYQAQATSSGATTRSVEDTDGLTGTLPYMAPEQLRGETIDARTDLFAAGCVLYELITGRRAFAEKMAPRLMDSILHQAPAAPRAVGPGISAELERIILKCLEKDAGERYQSAGELAVDLRRLETGRVIPTAALARPGRQGRWVTLAGAVAAVVLIAVGVIVGRDRWWALSARPIQSIAVLPLENLMGDSEQEYIVAAMHEALIGELGQIGALEIKSRTSVMRYRKTDKSVPEIARELDVDALVEGSMFKTGEAVRVQVRLIRAAPVERPLWSQTYDGDLRDVLELQKRVARAIAGQIRVTVTPHEAARLAMARRVDPAAYDAWAKGWFQSTRTNVESLNKCLDYAAAALAIDSSYAPAYALRASCYNILPHIASVAPGDAFPKAMVAARHALELDEGLADAHFALAWTLAAYDWNWAGAEREYRRGLQLNPNSALGHSRFGWFLSWIGRDDEAVAEVNRAVELDPVDPSELTRLAAVHYVARRYDEAIVAASRAIDIDPTYAFAYDRLGRACTEKGMYQRAIVALETAVKLSGGPITHGPVLGRAYALAGRRSDAVRVLEELLKLGQSNYVGPFHIAMLYTALGDKRDALRWLEEGYRVRDGNMVLLKVLPEFDPLRADPRFRGLVQRMKYP